MSMNNQGRPSRPEDIEVQSVTTFTGNRALQIEEPLIFETGHMAATGVDLPEPKGTTSRLGGLERKSSMNLPGLAEPEAMRHFVRLSQKNYAIDMGPFPLGSCTMKHNPRLNEKMARLPGFADIHPLQPVSTVQGALELIDTLAGWLKELTAMPAVAMSPKAGAHGELCGMVTIKAALEARGEAETRTRVLAPESAHGTNPATAAQCGFTVDGIPADETGRVDIEAFKAKLGPDVAAIMVTNPNTCGLFERDIREMADAVHEAGGYFYCDGANFNAIVGKVKPGDLGIDAMHINLHKTFSTPHGGGGPGSGPTVLSAALAPFAPIPYVVSDEDGFHLVEKRSQEEGDHHSFGRMTAFHGQMGMFVRALSYMLSHGGDGLRQAAEDAVLNANYVLARLSEEMTPAFEGTCMHEALFNDDFLKDTGVGTLDFAKAMIDEGYHPMTMYFPLVVHGAMLIEPTETESKHELDLFCDALLSLAKEAKAGNADKFKAAPVLAPRRRLDETAAARKPVLRWEPSDDKSMAAE
ncbi:aminomethyl-transferring glycine dehydrogenase subunit GcvPB [Aquisalinus flavus]|uniref:glycine dehydrogenase (aminomethyl-transferring) n=1 Tax=Aquisalinus flavus TaxID=1526572 RepID=A0A8J2Y613_9PROT|nr:aminomethyl-transferring glycine dehydrogenase subunit GcvPB [Aquisalinus flavus]MBD0426933.1 aminomethyl-transferring glycine dehydrogenase subunit GcvPB [Aquisalinus flavus]UNE46775.1 glycine dehydrogenase subunit 2 [Aquisalinus flavus]GGC97071.1 glycine dehydrogenase (aminomethyl-transferring) [Aquisalinus flavus]